MLTKKIPEADSLEMKWNDFIPHIKVIQHVYLAVTISTWEEDQGNPPGFYKVVSLSKILDLNLVRWYQRLELYIKITIHWRQCWAKLNSRLTK